MNEMQTYTAEQELEVLRRSIEHKDLRPFWPIHEHGSLSTEHVVNYISSHAPKPPSVCLPFLYNDWKYLRVKKDLSCWPRCAALGAWLESLAHQHNQIKKQKSLSSQSLEELFFWESESSSWLFTLDKSYSFEWLNVTWQRIEELDPSFSDLFYTLLYTPQGEPFILKRPDTSHVNYFDGAYWHLEVRVADIPENNETNRLFEDIAWALRARPEQIEYHLEWAGFIPCQVMRQDDHGNEFEMAQFDSHLEGHWYVKEMEKAVHKQTYWVQTL